MKTLTKIFAGLAMLGAVACQMYEIDTQMTPEKAAASIRMECSAVDTYTLPAQNPGNITFNVSSNTPWTITLSSGADWLTVTPASSSSSALITDVVVTAQENTSTTDRSATLTLRGDNIVNGKTITIKQSRAGRLFVTPMANDYTAIGGPLTFTIQTNLPWEVRSSEGWLTFNRENGEPDPDGRTITIVATAAPSEVLERTATVTVVAGDEQESFDVTQKGTFSITEISSAFEKDGGSKTISLRTDLPWSIVSDKDWLSFDKEEGDGDGSKIAIAATASENAGPMREAKVTVTAGGVDKVFTVKQKGFDFEIIAPASTELDRKGETITLDVNSSIAWEPFTETPGWTVEKVDASHLKLTAAWNGQFTKKVGKVAIKGAGDAKAELELEQDINFTFKGHYDILEDGSIKVYEDETSGIYTIDNFQYAIVDVDVEMHQGDKATFMICTEHYSDGYEYELQFNTVRSDSQYRLRSAGSLTGSGSQSSSFTFDKAKANAMTHAQVQFLPDATDASKISLSFYCDGTKQGESLTVNSAFAANTSLAGNYSVVSIGGDYSTTDGSYFIIKSCTVTAVE